MSARWDGSGPYRLSRLLRDFGRAEEINRENLYRILQDNGRTAYGREMAFDRITSERAYRERVPCTVYEDYEGLCEPMRYTAYPIRCRLATSGSTGEQKVFPLTEEALNRYGSYICDMPYYQFGGAEGPHLHTSVFHTGNPDKMLLSSAYYGWLKEQKLFVPAAYAGGERLLFAEDITDVSYVKAWLMLCTPALASIQSVFLYDVLLIMRYLEENWRRLLADMQAGQVGAAVGQEVKERLLSCLPSREVLERAEAVLMEGFERPVLPRLFEGLRFISGIGGESMAFQTKALARYSGDVPVCYFSYTLSECMAGIALYPKRAEYALLPYSAYYEFVREDGVCAGISELEPGVCYEPVITTFGGLYRYRTADILRVTAYEKETPVFTVAGRKRTVNVAGEKLSEQLLAAAFQKWESGLDAALWDYAVGIEYEAPARYLAFAEVTGSIDREAQERKLDHILQSMSEDYRDIRRLGMLRGCKLLICGRGSIAQAAAGEGHRKHHILLKEAQTLRLM